MKKLLLTASVFIAVLLMASCSLYDFIDRNSNNNNNNNNIYKTDYELDLNDSEGKNILSGADVYSKVAPSMVSIVNISSGKQSEGSGIIMSEDGYIITNAHVIENAQSLKVYINDENNTEYTTKNFWYDTYTDLGVVKISAGGLTAAEFGDPEEIRIGDDIYTIGNPGGMEFKYSMSEGIVSYKYRPYSPIADSGYSVNVFQVTAPINPGNSGGALINVYGQVIGINSAKIVAEGFEGLGFAISIADASPIISDLISESHAVLGRPALGITYDANYIAYGVKIMSINIHSKVDDAGLKVGDIITKIGDITINSTASIKAALKGEKAGNTVRVEYKRNNILDFADVELIDATLLE